MNNLPLALELFFADHLASKSIQLKKSGQKIIREDQMSLKVVDSAWKFFHWIIKNGTLKHMNLTAKNLQS